MENLLKIFGNISIEKAIEIEKSDFQYIALKNLYLNIENKDFYLPLIIANSIVCYQLSSTGEKYWEEFSIAGSKFNFEKIEDIYIFFKDFLPNSKGNKRFIETKLKRLEKINFFLKKFFKNEKIYYTNMVKLQEELAITMNQKKTDKTIVFAIKMFSYGARNYFGELIIFPFEINIPIDSRLTKIYEIYNEDKNLKINDFYKNLSEKLKIPELHLDAVIWVNFEKLNIK